MVGINGLTKILDEARVGVLQKSKDALGTFKENTPDLFWSENTPFYDSPLNERLGVRQISVSGWNIQKAGSLLGLKSILVGVYDLDSKEIFVSGSGEDLDSAYDSLVANSGRLGESKF